MNHIPGPLPLPKQSVLFRNARARVGDAYRDLGTATEWLHGDWDPSEGGLPAVASAARSTALRKVTAARALLDDAVEALDAANEHYRAQRRAADAPQIPADRSCGRDAAHRVEGYSPRNGLLHGSLDVVVYACPDHHDIARREWLAGLAAYSCEVAASLPPPTCGLTHEYQRSEVQR
ncbi:hypothetical protein [Nocardia wallacei]|uniref:hypothetical protein n=1 Tax=Nocardia wallacei TaxID=480035 RepID=UPI002453C0B0|nr:hypothetical protein [Nocardia wallacei]